MTRRRRWAGLPAAAALLSVAGCGSIGFLTGRCEAESIAVDWPVRITRGGVATSTVLTASATRANIGDQYELMAAALVDGTISQDVSVAWSVPAFDGGHVSIRHRVVPGPTASTIVDGGDAGGWGIVSRAPTPLATIRTPAVATVTGGSFQSIGASPARYRIVVEAREASGATLRIDGDASFSRRLERRACD